MIKMNEFICKRCDSIFSIKSHLKSHLLKKNPCKFIDKDYDRDILISELYQKTLNDKTYNCEYCQMKFNYSSNKSRHKKVCKNKPLDKITVLEKTVENLVSQIEDLKKQPTNITNNNNKKSTINLDLELELQYYKNRKNEKFYQLLLENYLGGTHKTLSCGITDVTTDTCHAEIKEWSSWKEAIGQLTCYSPTNEFWNT